MSKTARETVKNSKLDTWYDKVFVRNLIKEVQKVDPEVGAMIFPELNQIVFYWKRIIIHKVWMDEYNTEDLKLEDHKKKVADTIRYIKSGLINIHELQAGMVGFNKNKTGKLIT